MYGQMAKNVPNMSRFKIIKRAILIVLTCVVLISTGCQASPGAVPPSSSPQSPIAEPAPPSPVTQSSAVRVIDGDTIEVDISGSLYRVRYIGIDTPETVHPTRGEEPYGKEASAKNKELVEGKVVHLEKDVSETDQYGRLLRYVWVGDLMVNAELVRLGYAQVATYPPDVKYQDLFLKLQREAREAGRGLWATNQPTQTQGNYVGSTRSDKYHYPDCYWAQQIKPDNLIWFSSAREALDKGYTPCKVCNPPTSD
jgi:micrococcal nuclease